VQKRREQLVNTRLKLSRRFRTETQKVTEQGAENQKRDDARTVHLECELRIVDCGATKVPDRVASK